MLIQWPALVIRKEPMSWSLANPPGCTVYKKPRTRSLPQGLLMGGTRHQDCALSNPDHRHICRDLTTLLQNTSGNRNTIVTTTLETFQSPLHYLLTNICSSWEHRPVPPSTLRRTAQAAQEQLEESQTDDDWPHASSVGALATLGNQQRRNYPERALVAALHLCLPNHSST